MRLRGFRKVNSYLDLSRILIIDTENLTLYVGLAVQVSVLEGALDCWVFLSCLEVLHRIEGCCDPAQLAANCSHTVGLWAYATDKVTKQILSLLLWEQTVRMWQDTLQACLGLILQSLLLPPQLKSLGELCGLVSEKGPTSEDLNRTVDLLAGLGDERPETGGCFDSAGK